jgi:DDE superfamily endonuclease
MPRTSAKQVFLSEMQDTIAILILVKILKEKHRRQIVRERQQQEQHDESSDDDADDNNQLAGCTPSLYQLVISDPIIRKALLVLDYAERNRYLLPRGRRHKPVPTSKFSIDLNPMPVHRNDLQPWLNDIEFLNAYRMTRRAFHILVEKIRDHPVFSRKKRGPPQVSVEHQLMTLLHYLSSPGSSASGNRTRNFFHIAYGSKDVYVYRCVRALRACLRSDHYTWPDANERSTLAKESLARYGIPNAIGVVDGTTFRLMLKPSREDAADYSGRKEGYTITNIFVSDIHRKIRHYVSGWAGCAHDNRIWKNCYLYLNPAQYFSPQEYLLGDSAFDNGNHMVTTYRAPTGGLLRGTKKRFNELIAKPRVISEHVNGILKGRWNWLNSIPNVLNEETASMERILLLVDVIVILHNFLIDNNLNEDEKYFYTPGDNEDDDLFLQDEDDELNRAINEDAPSTTRREQLRAYLSEKGLL